ncbi:2-keto-4-pentenoate hydratase [Acidipila sp. EB88]|uniref:2-keto-4-pentenoate hydratase n=1 Tax=Acidipila sp. EB88 TaxID=2305226 RepID=UPI000F602364|nr:2-keto-4-pentenoate hydratase [Acidipila sp. EB88]RRA50158.1 2-keto-4-pentenoate hydratase [Acidipila sp. EB88]
MGPGWTTQAFQTLCDSERTQQTAQLLLEARHGLRPIHDLDPALLPASLEEAYAIQNAMASHLGPVGGWKIGAPRPDATPMFGPMPLGFGFLRSGEELPAKFSRFRGVEAEIGFLLRKDLPVRAERYTRQDILEAIASVHPVIEVLESAFIAPDEASHLAMVADLQMNGGFVHGPAVENWQQIDIASETLEVVVDGVIRWEGVGRNTNGPDLLRLLEYLANEGQFRTGGLQVGQWITTGSWMGKLLAHERSAVEVRFAHFGAVAMSFAK